MTWREHLRTERLAASAINNRVASLVGFAAWMQAQDTAASANGVPAKGIGDPPLPPLESLALDEDQLRSLKIEEF